MTDKTQAPHVQVGVFDLNGQMRGKRLPASKLDTILKDGFRMPISIMGIDIWGRDIPNSELVFESGDGDGYCIPTGRGPLTVSTAEESTVLVPCTFLNEDKTPFLGDPRQALAHIVDRYKAKGLTVVVATEMEFYLTDPESIYGTAQMAPINQEFEVLEAIDTLDLHEPFLNAVYKECEAWDVPADAVISEGGTGQFEINLNHVPDPLKAADDAMLFKRIVRSVARDQELAATFMAKPFGDRAGNGLHVHFSVLDKDGNNIFANGTDEGSDLLKHAVAGCLDMMPASMAIFAPHYNSYRRFAAHSHAPSAVGWGYENRTAAIRIPGGPDIARRIEHRVAGGDANVYLILAAILGGALHGIETKAVAPDPITGDAYAADLEKLPNSWEAALDIFEASEAIGVIFDPILKSIYLKAKRQELERFETEVSAFEYRTYLNTA
ncbi:glutamine synthetase [Amylibacter sp. SFDW26]|uniref:glutamine synthetase family protein n=1 Tax=Amylibacter sp. SFDW26 TaxID=2652722 RepID=UPI0012627D24|nr:glutamine synthetase family protein [Amylibacter sp. SFDW26]KAB7614589.1 glutamine synthetase [Amylibacter sp. SFDW26]